MINKKEIIILICFYFTLISCEDNKSYHKINEVPPPPEIPLNVICEEEKRIAYAQLKKGYVRIVFEDTIKGATKSAFLYKVLEKKFDLIISDLYQPYLEEYCMIFIMDSVIASRYGKNGKDSIINLAYKITDSLYHEYEISGDIEIYETIK